MPTVPNLRASCICVALRVLGQKVDYFVGCGIPPMPRGRCFANSNPTRLLDPGTLPYQQLGLIYIWGQQYAPRESPSGLPTIPPAPPPYNGHVGSILQPPSSRVHGCKIDSRSPWHPPPGPRPGLGSRRCVAAPGCTAGSPCDAAPATQSKAAAAQIPRQATGWSPVPRILTLYT